MVVNSGVHFSLHANCHHQIVFAKFDLKVYYPPPYEREVWHYQEADAILVRRAIHAFNWKRALSNLRVDEQVTVFDRTILNIMKNFIPHETFVCDDKDPPWFNKRIKSLIQEGTLLFETFRNKRNNVEIITGLNNLNDRLALLISTAKQNYYSKIVEKLQNTQRSSRAYWSSLKIFLNNKKIPIIPPLYHKNKFVIDFKKKAELFNSFFTDQCSLVSNSSELPSQLKYLTQSRLLSITFSKDDIAKMIQNLDPNKVHSHDQISIRMLKLCSTSICKPLEIIFNRYLETGTFPNDWKKGNVVPVFKKGDKQILKNYRPILLLPVCGKILRN